MTVNVKLERPTAALKKAYLDFVGDWERRQEDITPYAYRIMTQKAEKYRIWAENML